MRKTAKTTSLLLAALLALAGPYAVGHPQQPVPLDFITGGGWFIVQAPARTAFPGERANFGWHGGVKNEDWWGNGNYIDHGTGLHVRSLSVTGYLKIGEDGTAAGNGQPTGTRDVCGVARTNQFGDVEYRVRMKDAGEPGRRDQFAIALYDAGGFAFYMAWGSLGDPTDGGGNIQLHKGNASNTRPPEPPECQADVFTDLAFS